MNNFIKFLLSLTAIAAFTLVPPVYADSSQTIKIGVIVPLSGDMSSHGIEVQRSIELALSSYDQSKLKYNYQLFFEDNQLNQAKSVAAANKLINIQGVDIIITLWPPTAEVVLPLSEKKQVLHYTIAWDPNLAKNHKFLLSHQAMVNDIARASLKLLKGKGKTRIAFLHMEESGFNIGSGFINQYSSDEGIEIIRDEAYDPNQTDFRTVIARTEKAHPDGYLIWGVAPSIDILIKQLNEQNKSAFKTGYFDYVNDLNLIEGCDYVSEMYSDDNFNNLYYKKFNSLPKSKGANAFDIISLLIDAYEGSPQKILDSSELKHALTRIKNRKGAVGIFSIDEYGNSFYSPVIRSINKGQRIMEAASLGDK